MPAKLNLDSAVPPTSVDDEFKIYDDALSQLADQLTAGTQPAPPTLIEAITKVQQELRIDDPGSTLAFTAQTHLIDKAIAVGQQAADFINSCA